MIEIRSLRDIIRLLFIFKRQFIYAAVATLVVTVAGALFLPSRYESQARILVKPNESLNPPAPTTLGDGGNTFMQPSTQRDPVLDEQKLMTSQPVITAVAQAYLQAQAAGPEPGLWKHLKYYARRVAGGIKEALRRTLVALGILDDASATDRTARALAKKFEVSHDPGSNVMDISFRWGDPGVAQAINTAWVDAYFNARAKASGGAQLYSFYHAQTEQLSKHIIELQGQLHQRLKLLDAPSIQQQLDSIGSQLQRLQQQRQDAISGKEALQSMLDTAHQQLSKLPAEAETGRNFGLNPAREDLQLKLNNLVEQRLSLLRVYLPGAPPVKAMDASISELQSRLQAMAPDVQLSRDVAPNGLAAKLHQDVMDGVNQSAALAARIDAIDGEVNSLRSLRSEVLAAEPELSQLSLQLSTAERVYTQYTDYLLHAQITRDLDLQRLSNAILIETPTLEPSRVFPKTVPILLLALPAAISVGLLVIFLCYLLDQRIHDGGRIPAVFGLPLWASLPDLNDPNRPEGSHLNTGLFRIYGLLPRSQIHDQGLTLGLTSSHQGEGVRFVADHLCRVLREADLQVLITADPAAPRQPGTVTIVIAEPISRERALLQLRDVDIRLLVIEARHTSVTTVEYSLNILRHAFGQIDGLILNRRCFEIPADVLRRFGGWLRVS
ncbi:GumC family protein [Frateuria aurantia]